MRAAEALDEIGEAVARDAVGHDGRARLVAQRDRRHERDEAVRVDGVALLIVLMALIGCVNVELIWGWVLGDCLKCTAKPAFKTIPNQTGENQIQFKFQISQIARTIESMMPERSTSVSTTMPRSAP